MLVRKDFERKGDKMKKEFEDDITRFFIKNCPNDVDIIDNINSVKVAILKYFSKLKVYENDKFLLTINTQLGALMLRSSIGRSATKVTKIVKEFKGCTHNDDLDLKGTWEDFVDEVKSK